MGTASSRWVNHRSITVVVVLFGILAAGFHQAAAAPPEAIGPEFETFHSESGGVHVFGYAISPRVIEDDRLVQYFERQRFEFHPENMDKYEVLLGRLGSEEAKVRDLLDSGAFKPLGPEESPDAKCRYFEQTGHQICGGFKQHWESNGLRMGDAGISERESLALFGYPISREFTDPETGLTVQYFERARFEYHEELKGTPYEVLLGRVGSPLWDSRHASSRLAPELYLSSGVPSGNFIWPAEGTITQEFGHTSFSQSSGGYGTDGHTGLDIANSVNTPIHAADGGTVTVAGWSGGLGYAVAIDHGNGIETWYGHMVQQPSVSVGQRVSQGDVIGLMGSTGFSTGPHVHFEVRVNGSTQNPVQYLP